MPHESNPLLLSQEEAARLLRVSTQTLGLWRRMARIPYVKDRGRIYYHLADLQRIQRALKEEKRAGMCKRVLLRLGLPPKYVVHHRNGGEPGEQTRAAELDRLASTPRDEEEERP